MSYNAGKRLPAQRASSLGHLEVLQSDLVNELVQSFKNPELPDNPAPREYCTVSFANESPFSVIFGVDGSLQVIDDNDYKPRRRLAYVKTAMLRLNMSKLARIDKKHPHPLEIRDLLEDSAIYHATVFPLRNITLLEMSIYHAVRRIVYDSLKDASLQGEPLETLKWLIYQKWDRSANRDTPPFECPHCREMVAQLPFDAETGNCQKCGGELLITDMLGFHQEMTDDFASDVIPSTYMSIHENLMLFTGIRYFWENCREMLSECLFVKDGPLTIRAQYSKLVQPIRQFLSFAKSCGYPAYILGQEKTGLFVDHLAIIYNDMPANTVFIPGDAYIKKEIQQRPDTGAPYGKDTNYGAKIFVNYSGSHHMVLSIPTGEFNPNPTYEDLIGIDKVLVTLPHILSYQYENALMPIVQANNIASLSTYPSAHILRLFSRTGTS